MPQPSSADRLQHVHNLVIELAWLVEDLARAVADDPVVSEAQRDLLLRIADKTQALVRGEVVINGAGLPPSEDQSA